VSDDSEFLRELQKEFLDELQFLLEACEESYMKIENPDVRVEELAKIFRLAHSIKGAGSTAGFNDLSSFAHVMEDCLVVLRSNPELVDAATITLLLKCGDAIKDRAHELRAENPPIWDISELKKETADFTLILRERQSRPSVVPPPLNFPRDVPEEVVVPVPAIHDEPVHATVHKSESTTIKVDSARVEMLLNIVGELVVIKSQILNEVLHLKKEPRLVSVVALLDKTIRELQGRTLSMRLTPLKSLFLKMQRVARDLSLRLGKPLEIVLSGEEIEIDRTLVESLSDPLMHLVRNCMDHGLETAELRREKGKPEKGRLTLAAQQVGDRVLLQIADDGAGINRERVIKKAVEAGLVGAQVDSAKLSDAEVFEFLFAPGFSTAEKVTDISGRGVGMNVVKEALSALKGRIEVESEFGKGACFKISVPSTTAITDGMLVSVEGRTYILPMHGIRELVDAGASEHVQLQSGQRLLKVRETLFPICPLAAQLRNAYAACPQGAHSKVASGREMAIVYEHETGCVALEVDAVLGQAQVVTKPLRGRAQQSDGIGGAAILGDGKVALLLDIDALL
jgi:two-component system, chemotaxis family, sensor kinase CheA